MSLPLPSIGVGTWAWGNQLLWNYSPEQDPELAACFERAVALGLHVFDTADSYGTGRFQGRSETLLGSFAAALEPEQRQRLTVATKLAPFPWRLGRGGLRRAFASSRQRLQGKLDRVQLHWSTARYAPWQEGPLLDGLADLVLAGEVDSLGVSNLGPRRLRLLHGRLASQGVPLVSVQVQLSLLYPQATAGDGVLAVARELGIETIAYSPLALGLLAGPIGGQPRVPPGGIRGGLFRRLEPGLGPLHQAMDAIACNHGADRTAVALNWCRAHGALPIPGLRSPAQVERAAAALGWCLDPAELEELDRQAATVGRRMPANPFESD